MITDRPYPTIPVPTEPADVAYRRVLAEGGATKPVRDAVTTYVAKTVATGTGLIPGTPADWPNGGFATYPPATAPADQNHNALPDAWEAKRGLKAGSSATGHELDPHYTNLEVYLNSL